MTQYTAPTRDMDFLLHEVLEVGTADIPGYEVLERDLTTAVLEEAGKIARDVLAPLNASGDQEGCRLENGVVYTPKGFKAAFEAMKSGGWTALDCDPEYGGQGMPYVLATAVGEMFVSANMAFNMYQGLTHGAYSAILVHGTGAFSLLAVGSEERLLPGVVVAEELADRIAKIGEKQGRRPGAKERKRLKEEVISELLPRAFVRPSRLFAYLDGKDG